MELKALARQFMDRGIGDALLPLLAGSKVKRLSVASLPASAPAMLLASLPPARHTQLVVCDDAESAAYMYNDLCQILGRKAVQILPSGYRRHIKYGQSDEPSRILRTEALAALSLPATRYLVTSPEGMAESVTPPTQVAAANLPLRKGQKQNLSALIDRLHQLGFTRTDYVYEPGQYAHRGSILDIYAYSYDTPLRLDFFDDEIDSIRTFDIQTQLSRTRMEQANILGPAVASPIAKGSSILEHLHPKSRIWCHHPASTLEKTARICSETLSSQARYTGEGDSNAMLATVDFDDFKERWERFPIVQYGTNPADFPDAPRIDAGCTPQGLYHKNFELITDSFKHLLEQGYQLYILTDTPSQTRRLATIFTDRGDDIPFTPVEPTLHEGFVHHPTRTCLFTDHQIFDRYHRYNLRSDKARGGRLALSLKELGQLHTGDYVVHIDHGIGRFQGLVRSSVAGTPQEMIKLTYQGDDIIYCSIHALHKLSKYRGAEGETPKLSKLGTGAWNRVKERTKAKMKEIARDLIALYAARMNQQGFAFSPDSYLQHELEASFIYQDTPDQATATAAVKADMESSRPMDRLICGDVGFGKTEIAVRAAFKAAADSRQTAILVPTTLLAMQHYHTFRERLKDMPVRVEFLSRAKTPKQTRQILQDLKEGKIDILIGTHRLISPSVQFKDLGLLIIDEEQKFGVTVKEKLRRLKTNVDTLTLTATPIPRTLQFSLMGARDLSNLLTPPPNRHPILTTVAPIADDIVREAIEYELARAGQLFFICNRIEALDRYRNMIQRLVPGARTVTAHGQMPPAQLEKAVTDFADGAYDILLSTTIVESGIDIPTVNTIIIIDAQNFGLSELHQLRGRVGRSNRKAFAYLLTPPTDLLTDTARRRLQAIENYTDLGSGIHIAMQDLDIRGAGNLLGAEQSGFIADLGYETYQKILKESLTELHTHEFPDLPGNPSHTPIVADCLIESDLELRLPPSYVPQEAERIALYQELDNITDPAQTQTFTQNLRDRFGEPPAVTHELIRIVPLRAQAKNLGIERLLLRSGKMHLYFTGPENKAYYQSPAFGRCLAYMQAHTSTTALRQNGEKRSMVIDNVPNTLTALQILGQIAQAPPI